MKKVVIVVVALLLALPAVSFAGSATSRWDLTIGGFVKIDAGYTSQQTGFGGLDEYQPARNNLNGTQNIANQNGSFAMGLGQTTLNFLVKGPDAWGAKTSAFIQGNFVGQTTNAGYTGTRYGTFTVSHAYMDFTWATTKLIVGQNWQPWGFMPSYNFLGLYDLINANRGTVVPQITVIQNFGKSFYGSFGIQDPYKAMDQLGGSNSLGIANLPTGQTQNQTGANLNPGSYINRVSSQIPDFTGEIGYKSDACGKIGPWNLQFGLGGFWGQDKVTYIDPAVKNEYGHSNVNRWAAAFKWFVPIIPEKNLNKAGALSFSGVAWTGQNMANFFMGNRNGNALIPYDQDPTALGVSYAAPVQNGGWAQLCYYFTDKVYMSGIYTMQQSAVSALYQKQFPTQIRDWKQYIVSVLYDVNPAVRVGIEGLYGTANYNGYALGDSGGGPAAPAFTGTALDTHGSFWTGRIAFWYFF